MVQVINGQWDISSEQHGISAKGTVPCSVYSALIENKLIPDPYVGINQYDALKYSEGSYTFSNNFIPEAQIRRAEKIFLRFKGIDTVSEIYFNDEKIGTTENMHRTYEFDVTELLRDGANNIRVVISSPIEYIRSRNEKKPLWGVSSTMEGYPHIRKAHYMFGWDWGPQLPDMGIWRPVELVGVFGGRIESVYVRQKHKSNSVRLKFEAALADISSPKLRAEAEITAPDGSKSTIYAVINDKTAKAECVIANPSLWNVRGYGKQNLYMVNFLLYDGDEAVDQKEFNIGLRTIEVLRDTDDNGESFCFAVNGTKIFAMGANYIPEDNIIARCSPQRTKELLKSCAAANYNMIRVWGGGFYPDDYFYDMCDKLGFLVWQDMMFACSVYDGGSISFCANVRYELVDNIKRARNHACLGMWCGNNEIESAWQYWGLPEDEDLRKGYLRMFETLAPKAVSQYDPQTFYWPSSPSSGGGFNDSGAMHKGDTHYWDVWHGLKPFDEYKKHLFRFCSEFGFESLPCMKTIRTFAEEKDHNLMGEVMEAHHKCDAGSEKLLYYIAQMVHYPYTFEDLVYASQLVQADAVRLCVEQMRRHRGTCMGSLYWQVNDSNPAISWSSIDYFGRWKALHYYAKRFYAPLLCSIDDSDKKKLVINVSNENTKEFSGQIKWRIRKNTGEIVTEGDKDITVPALTAINCMELTEEMTGIDSSLYSDHYLEYLLLNNSAVVTCSTYLFCRPKQFKFLEPNITFRIDRIGDMYRIRLNSDCYAKGVVLEFEDLDCVFSDNWIDMHGQETFLLLNKASVPSNLTEKHLEEQLKIRSYYDLCKTEKYR